MLAAGVPSPDKPWYNGFRTRGKAIPHCLSFGQLWVHSTKCCHGQPSNSAGTSMKLVPFDSSSRGGVLPECDGCLASFAAVWPVGVCGCLASFAAV
eukprot:4787412-Prymnesium_polylepis.2